LLQRSQNDILKNHEMLYTSCYIDTVTSSTLLNNNNIFLTPWGRVLLQKFTVIHLNSPLFMEHEGSLPCSQKPATDPHPQPDESRSHPTTTFP